MDAPNRDGVFKLGQSYLWSWDFWFGWHRPLGQVYSWSVDRAPGSGNSLSIKVTYQASHGGGGSQSPAKETSHQRKE